MTRPTKMRIAAAAIMLTLGALWLALRLHGLDINAAVRANDATGVKLLLMLGKSPNEKDPHGFCIGETPLHGAATMGGPDVMKALLDGGADPKARDSSGQTPLHLAASMPAYSLAFPTSEHMPSRQDYRTMVRMLVDAGADVNAKRRDGWTPLCLANDRFIVRYLLSKGADPLVTGKTTAGQIGFHDRRPDLGQQRAKGQVSVVTAILYDRPDLLAPSLSTRAAINAPLKGQSRTPLEFAVLAQSVKVAKWLVSKGADVRSTPSLLHEAVAQRDVAMVSFLVSQGARVNAKDAYEVTPMAIATEDYEPALSRYPGPWNHSDENAPSDSKATARIMAILAEHGADVNATACHCGSCDMETPLQWARRIGDSKLVEILKKHGAKD